jgi:hypothetical protein
MAGYNIKVSVKHGEMHVSARQGLTGGGYPHLFLCSSAFSAPVLDDRAWPTGLAWSVTDRLRNGGDEKGRVLAIWQEPPGKTPIPLASLTWHTHGTGPLYVFDLGHRTCGAPSCCPSPNISRRPRRHDGPKAPGSANSDSEPQLPSARSTPRNYPP